MEKAKGSDKPTTAKGNDNPTTSEHPAYQLCIEERKCPHFENLNNCPMAHIKAARDECEKWQEMPKEQTEKKIF